MVKNKYFLGILTMTMLLALAQAQSAIYDVRSVPLSESAEKLERRALVLPRPLDALDGVWHFKQTTIDIRDFGERIRYRASIDGITKTHWVSKKFMNFQVAFNEVTLKFVELEHAIRVELDDYDELDSIVQQIDAIHGTPYLNLDFALIQLSSNSDLMTNIDKVLALPGVRSATLVYRIPLNVPQ